MNLPDIKTLADRVLWARTKGKLTQMSLAKSIGSDQGQIKAIENGTTKRPRNLDKIAKATGVPEPWLMYGSNNSIKHEASNSHSVPILTWENVEAVPDEDTTRTQLFLPPGTSLSPSAFALEYDRPTPDWNDNYILIFDPDTETEKIDKYFCCKIQNEKTASLKYVTRDGDQVYYQSADIKMNNPPLHESEFSIIIPMIGRTSYSYKS